MAFLNLKKSGVGVEYTAHARYETELHATIPSAVAEEILPRLLELKQAEGSELRLDLPEGWTLFLKRRSGESRFLLAHPEPDQWVGTLALTESHLQEIVSAFSQKGRLSLSRLAPPGAPIAKMSNLEVSFTFL